MKKRLDNKSIKDLEEITALEVDYPIKPETRSGPFPSKETDTPGFYEEVNWTDDENERGLF